VKKGVYKDGHEREDVIEYCSKNFLPKMEGHESRMVKFVGPELKRVMPVLKPGEKRLIPYWHDECCMHAKDEVSSAW
jgi:hypothetical protein